MVLRADAAPDAGLLPLLRLLNLQGARRRGRGCCVWEGGLWLLPLVRRRLCSHRR